MLLKARRMADHATARRFDWPSEGASHSVSFDEPPLGAGQPGPVNVMPSSSTPAVSPMALADLEREAFARGHEQGERAGFEAGAQRADAMLRRLAGTIEELGTLRR